MPAEIKALIQSWRDKATEAQMLSDQAHRNGDQAGNAFAFLKEWRIRHEAANELEALLVDLARVEEPTPKRAGCPCCSRPNRPHVMVLWTGYECTSCGRHYQPNDPELVKAADPVPPLSQHVTCANCGHVAPHDGPAGDIADACTHPPGCQCGFFQAEVPAIGAEPPALEVRATIRLILGNFIDPGVEDRLVDYCEKLRSGGVALPPHNLEICICAAWRATDHTIWRGHRHNHCRDAMVAAGRQPSVTSHAQGFITSRNRFVDRREAARLQKEAQIPTVDKSRVPFPSALFSEDLY